MYLSLYPDLVLLGTDSPAQGLRRNKAFLAPALFEAADDARDNVSSSLVFLDFASLLCSPHILPQDTG